MNRGALAFSSSRDRRRSLLGAFAGALLALLLLVSPVRAQDRRAEARAREALQAAQTAYATDAYDKAIMRLKNAWRACTKCSSSTRALLLRDRGAIEWTSGDEDGGYAVFFEALALDPNADISQRYDTPEVHAAWAAAKDELAAAQMTQPKGDFVHQPPAAEAVRTPLPLYFEVAAPAAKVTLHFMQTGARDYASLDLSPIGKGFGGTIPCDKVVLGVIAYYVVGLDASGKSVAAGGDARHPYFVRVHRTIAPPAPSLPGQVPPRQCGEGETEAAVVEPRAASPPAAPTSSPRAEPAEPPAARSAKNGYARLWVGVSGSYDLTSLPSEGAACQIDATGHTTSAAGYVCTDPRGNAFPSSKVISDAIPTGHAGTIGGGAFSASDIRILLTVDYAATANLLVGGRVGYVTSGYIAQANGVNTGWLVPLHVEARVSYLFGDAPLAHVGFAPLLLGGLGLAEWDANKVVLTMQNGVGGQAPVFAWRRSGPFFVTAGGGIRCALSPVFALTTAARVSLAAGNGVLVSVSPEVALQYGF